MRPLLAVLALALVTLPCAARAEEPSIAPTHLVGEAPPAPRSWYGWQPLAVDAVAFGSLYATSLTHSDYLAMVGPTIYAFGGPMVHAFHGRWGASMGSLAVRVALPWAFAAIPSSCSSDGTDFRDSCRVNAMATRAIAGAALASIVDALALSWEAKPAPTLVPIANVTSTSASIGLSGVF